MRKTGWLFLYIVLSLFLSNCDDQDSPSYPIEPSIEFRSIKFIKTPDFFDADTIKLIIYFRDGDNDIGFSADLEDESNPYHPRDYYLGTGDGGIAKLSTRAAPNTVSPPLSNIIALNLPSNPSGKVITNNSRNIPAYSFLPEFSTSRFPCQNYAITNFIIPEESISVLDNHYVSYGKYPVNIDNKSYVLVKDTLYFTFNENHFNITIEFESSSDQQLWETFDWQKQFCYGYSGRLPLLNNLVGKINIGPFKIHKVNNFEGTIEYNMASTGFIQLFGSKSLRLKVKIRDRALHESNTIITPIIDWGN